MIYAFADCRLDIDRVELRRGNSPVPLEPQVFDLLVCLVEGRDRVLAKGELLDTVWGDRFVSESALTTQIKAARRAIGDDGTHQRLIRTVHGKGYRFVAAVAELAASASAPPSPVDDPGPAAPLSNLPVPVQSLFGRDQALQELCSELDARRLVTLVGPAGVGKTTLAIEAARAVASRFGDGVVTVELVTVEEADATVQALATALDASASQHVELEDAVVDLLRSRHALLLLDNCEHVVGVLGVLVDRILRACPGVSVLATSREPLGVIGEQLWPVEPLPVAEDASAPVEALLAVPAIALFADRAAAVDPQFAIEDHTAGAVAEICARLDGIPLAIELAAARVRSLDVTEIAHRLDERFRLLKGVRRGADPRHHTLLDAVRWSYDLLDDDEQRLFTRVSVFSGPFDLQAATDVCGVEGDGADGFETMDLLTRLAERSMVAVRRSGPAERGARYEVLETMRHYGRSRLDDGDALDLHARHARSYTRLGAEIETGCQGPAERSFIDRASLAYADLRAAQRYLVETGDVATAAVLVASMREFAMRAMRYETFAWAEAVLAAPGADGVPLSSTVKGMVAYGAWVRGEFATALALAEEMRREEDRPGRRPSGLAERVAANVRFVLGDLEEGIRDTARQLALAEEAGSPSRLAHAAYMHSVAMSSAGHHDEAVVLAARARELGRETGSPTDIASGWAATGFASDRDVDGAIDAFDTGDRVARAAGNRWLSTFVRTEMYGLLFERGDLRRACAGLADVVDIWFRAGEWSQQWITLSRCLLGVVAIDDTELAARLVGAIRERSALATVPAMGVVRQRALEVASDLEDSLGPRFHELAALGARMPVVDIVAETRAALRGGRARR